MRLLLTRPGQDGEKTAQLLRQLGYEVVCAPLLRIEMLQDVGLDLSGVQGLLATSANGVRALSAHTSKTATALPLYAVGDASANAARELGFATVFSADGDVASLAALVAHHARPEDGRLVHVAGNVRAGDLQHLLQDKGYRVDLAVLYESQAVDALDDDVKELLRSGDVNAVLLYSPRTAHIYVQLVRLENIVLPRALMHICLSPAVAAALEPLHLLPDQIRVAKRPRQDDLFAGLSGLR